MNSVAESKWPVCHLIDASVGSRYFSSIARHHDRERYPVTIGSLAPTGALQEMVGALGVPSFTLDGQGRADYPQYRLSVGAFPGAVAHLASLLRRERISVLHSHCFDPTIVGLLAARLAGVRFVFTRHHSDHHIRVGKRYHTRVDGWCGRRADRVIAVSEAVRQIMLSVEGVPASKMTVVHNGMEPLPNPSQAEVTAVRRELGLTNERVCLVIARLHEEKGHRVLFDAIPLIQSRVDGVVFLLVGAGPARTELEEDVRARGLSDVVRFLGWRTDVPALIATAALVALPSLAESFGFSLVEAMSLGVPVVASATGGVPEIVEHGESGLLVRPGDARALAHAISSLLADPQQATKLAKSGRQKATMFGFDAMMRGYECVYDEVCAERERGGRFTGGVLLRSRRNDGG